MLDDILNESAMIIHVRKMLLENDTSKPIVPQILIRAQVPRLRGVDTSSFDKLLYHVRENQKVLHIKAKPDPEVMVSLAVAVAAWQERGIDGGSSAAAV